MDSYEGLRLSTLARLRSDVEAGWQQVAEGNVTEFDPEAVKRRGRQKLAKIAKERP
jgi:hypothetical protein